MSTRRKTAQAKALAAEQADREASYQLLDEWLRIENEHTDPGFVLPDREAIVAWSETHPVTVLFFAGVAVWGPVLSAITFG